MWLWSRNEYLSLHLVGEDPLPRREAGLFAQLRPDVEDIRTGCLGRQGFFNQKVATELICFLDQEC